MHDEPVTEPQAEARPTKCQLHGVLVRVFDVGVLLLGESGIGKSECALDLITRGHQLIADDAVEIFSKGNKLVAKAPELTRHLLEIRGLGIINVSDIFGDEAVGVESEIELCVELRKSIAPAPLENVVSDYQVAGISMPRFVLPVSPGRDLATLVETAVRLYRNGNDTVGSLIEKHAKLLRSVEQTS